MKRALILLVLTALVMVSKGQRYSQDMMETDNSFTRRVTDDFENMMTVNSWNVSQAGDIHIRQNYPINIVSVDGICLSISIKNPTIDGDLEYDIGYDKIIFKATVSAYNGQVSGVDTYKDRMTSFNTKYGDKHDLAFMLRDLKIDIRERVNIVVKANGKIIFSKTRELGDFLFENKGLKKEGGYYIYRERN